MAKVTKIEGYNQRSEVIGQMLAQLIGDVSEDARRDVERVNEASMNNLKILQTAMSQIIENQTKTNTEITADWSTEAPAARIGKNKISEPVKAAAETFKEMFPDA